MQDKERTGVEMEEKQLWKLTTKQNQEKNLQGMANWALTRSGMWGIHESDEKVKRPTFQY